MTCSFDCFPYNAEGIKKFTGSERSEESEALKNRDPSLRSG
jgi:hypothetical protein